MKQSLNEFAESHPHENNPANAFACKVVEPTTGKALNTDENGVESTEKRQQQLEKTVRRLLTRLESTTKSLEQAKLEVERKNKLVTKYEAYYKELKRSVEKREAERKPSSTPPSNDTKDSNDPAKSNPSSSSSTSSSTTTTTTTTTIADLVITDQPILNSRPLLQTHVHPPISTTTTLPSMGSGTTNPSVPLASAPGIGLGNAVLVRHKHPTTSTLEASLQRSAALEKKDKRK